MNIATGMSVIALSVAAVFLSIQVAAVRRAADAHRPGPLFLPLVSAATVGWLALWYFVASRGALADVDARPPPLFLIFPATLGMGVALGFSSIGTRVVQSTPVGILVMVQGFRLPLEVVMHEAALQKTMPMQMSWSGFNFDVVTGAAALLVGALALLGKAPRALVWAWVVLSFITLVTVVGIGAASTPVFHAFGTAPEQLNTWLADPPYVWLPVVMVAFALAGQFWVVRRLNFEGVPA